jgi:hypothetical protein
LPPAPPNIIHFSLKVKFLEVDMSRKLLAIVLSLALLAGGVAVGIHILNQKALANVTYTVEIWDFGEGSWLTTGEVYFQFDGGGWVPAFNNADGSYELTIDEYKGSWSIWLFAPDIDEDSDEPPGNPIDGSASQAYQYWNVSTDVE